MRPGSCEALRRGGALRSGIRRAARLRLRQGLVLEIAPRASAPLDDARRTALPARRPPSAGPSPLPAPTAIGGSQPSPRAVRPRTGWHSPTRYCPCMSPSKRRNGDSGPASEFREEARWSSFTNSWSRPFRGWHWPLRAREVVTVLLVGAAGGAILWGFSMLLRALLAIIRRLRRITDDRDLAPVGPRLWGRAGRVAAGVVERSPRMEAGGRVVGEGGDEQPDATPDLSPPRRARPLG